MDRGGVDDFDGVVVGGGGGQGCRHYLVVE